MEIQREKDRQIISQAMVTFAYLVDAKDQYTQEHSVRVALYSEEIARRMGMSEADATLIRYIALVHDCGKVGVPDAYDAMSSDRCYRSHLSKEKILEELNRYSGEQFEPELVKYMIDMIEDGFTYNIHHYDDDGREVKHLEEVFK